MENPHIPANRLTGFDCAYKIKLRSAGYRLVYEVDNEEIIVFIIAVGKRENNSVYDKARDIKNNIIVFSFGLERFVTPRSWHD